MGARSLLAEEQVVDVEEHVYQPRIDLATGCCVGAEALLRWRHPHLGEISPGEFVPIIEHLSLARLTTPLVLGTALDQLLACKTLSADVVLSVNISAAKLSEVDLVQRIQLGLVQGQLRPERLEIELTETAIMDQRNRALAMFGELAETGMRLAIDDFGRGHSSLAYLQWLPAHVLKIDQTFVRGCGRQGRNSCCSRRWSGWRAAWGSASSPRASKRPDDRRGATQLRKAG